VCFVHKICNLQTCSTPSRYELGGQLAAQGIPCLLNGRGLQVERICQLEAEREQLLVLLSADMQQHVLKRQREAAVEEGEDGLAARTTKAALLCT
jgi:hypothetical protein